MNVAESEKPGSVGEFGWAGAAKTYYWVDPQEKIIGILMSQSMMQFEKPEADFQVLGLSSVHRLVNGVISVISGLYYNPLPFLDIKKLCGGSTCRI